MSEVELMHGDCLERMKEIEPGSVDLVLTDPPYGTVERMGGESVSHGMTGKTAWDVCIDHDAMLDECNRVMRTNGAMCLFSQEPYTSKLITEQHGNLPFSYRYVWVKDHFANSLIAKKAPVNYTEDVCVFFKAYDDSGISPIREYAKNVLAFIGKTRTEISKDVQSVGLRPTVTSHFFCSGSATQFGLPVADTYQALIDLYSIDKMDGFLSYHDLREWNSRYTRTFNLPPGKKYKSNVLEYRKDYGGHHPTQKPVALLEDLIRTYTNEGDRVLDFTMRSGSTGFAAVNTGRNFIGIELDSEYFNIAQSRIQETKERLV